MTTPQPLTTSQPSARSTSAEDLYGQSTPSRDDISLFEDLLDDAGDQTDLNENCDHLDSCDSADPRAAKQSQTLQQTYDRNPVADDSQPRSDESLSDDDVDSWEYRASSQSTSSESSAEAPTQFEEEVEKPSYTKSERSDQNQGYAATHHDEQLVTDWQSHPVENDPERPGLPSRNCELYHADEDVGETGLNQQSEPALPNAVPAEMPALSHFSGKTFFANTQQLPTSRQTQTEISGCSATIQTENPDAWVAEQGNEPVVIATAAESHQSDPTVPENSEHIERAVVPLTQSETDHESSDGHSHGDGGQPDVGPITLGDEVLQGLQQARGDTVSDAQASVNEKLLSYIEQVVDRIAILETGQAGESEVRIALNDSLLPDTEIVVSRQHSHIIVNFLTRSGESFQLLDTHQRLLETQLSDALNKPVTVSVDVSTDQQDGRSRGQRDVYAELQED